MSLWATDPELFLYKGKDGVVHLRRCKKETTSTTSMLMNPEDFKDEGAVTNYLCLFGGHFEWDKKKYEALIDYICSKHLLVNRRGSLIVELATDDKAAPVVYIRALDILALGSYGVGDRKVRARTVKYLQDGKDVPTDPNPKETKLTKDLAQKTKEAEAFQQDLAKEKKTNKTLRERNAELEEANKNCGTKPPPTVRIYTAADTGYSLTIRDGHVILGLNDEYDVNQHWVKDDKYGSSVKDASGLPCYALVNKFTGEAMKPPSAAMEDVQLVLYNPDILDRSILWSEHEQGDGYRAIRSATHTSLNLDAFPGDKAHGVSDGTAIKVGNWLAGNNQRWNIVPTDPNPKETKLTKDLAQKTKEADAFQQDLAKEKKTNKTLRERNAELEEANKNCGSDEAWMKNGDTGSDWVGAEALYEFRRPGALLTVIGARGTFTVEDDKTNVRANYFYKIKFDFFSIPMKAVLIQDLIPNKEKARFHRTWVSFKHEENIYVTRNLTVADRELKG